VGSQEERKAKGLSRGGSTASTTQSWGGHRWYGKNSKASPPSSISGNMPGRKKRAKGSGQTAEKRTLRGHFLHKPARGPGQID